MCTAVKKNLSLGKIRPREREIEKQSGEGFNKEGKEETNMVSSVRSLREIGGGGCLISRS